MKVTDPSSLAAKLYDGSAARKPVVESEGTSTSSQPTLAERLYGPPPTSTEKTPPSPSAETKAPPAQADPKEKDIAKTLFEESQTGKNGQYATLMKPGLETISKALKLTPEQTQEMGVNTSKLFSELNVESPVADKMHTLYAHHLTNPPDAATVEGWAKVSETKLQERFGNETQSRLAAAREYVKVRGLGTVLEHSGLGSHPDVVLELADRAWRLKMAGKLK